MTHKSSIDIKNSLVMELKPWQIDAQIAKYEHLKVVSGTSRNGIYNQLDKPVSIKNPLSHLNTGHDAVLGKDAGRRTINTNRQSC